MEHNYLLHSTLTQSTMNQTETNKKGSESQLYFNWIDDYQLKVQLTYLVKEAKANRKETQKELTNWLNISLTKVKEIENGTCKDFNAINNYLNFLGCELILKL